MWENKNNNKNKEHVQTLSRCRLNLLAPINYVALSDFYIREYLICLDGIRTLAL